MTTRTKLLAGLAASLVGLLALGGGSFWYLFLRDDAPPEVSLAAAVQSLATSAAKTTGAQATPSPPQNAPAVTAGVDGTWTVAEAGETFVGYRVKEELVSVGAVTAVGRTTEVEAEFIVEDGELVSGSVTANLAALKSDKTMRDNALRNQGLQTSQYPTATFVADGGLVLPDAIDTGAAISVAVSGKLTLHGVTRDVDVPLELQMVDGRLVAVGSIEIVFADYNITRPSAASVLSIEDHGVMELQIVLQQPGGAST
jgi:polyisoprenoid-binding protein YceI